MDWLGIDVAKLGGEFITTFWNKRGPELLPDPDMARNVVLTAVTFALGWATSQGASKAKLKQRVINELILSQSELRARAYPKVWRQADVREAWMLDPFVARLRFLYADLSERKALSGKQLGLIENYIARVEEFIAKWSETLARHESYHYAYSLTYNGLRAATTALGLKEAKRFAGLNSPKDGLFGAAAAVVAATPPTSPAPAPNGAFVPAE